MKDRHIQFHSTVIIGKDHHMLVGGLEHDFYDFPYVGNNSRQLTSIFFRGVAQPPTSMLC
jgi:hypothetical protein